MTDKTGKYIMQGCALIGASMLIINGHYFAAIAIVLLAVF